MYSEQYDESIDIYAFGMCLLEMATGEYPYQECTKPFEIYKRVTQGIKPENYFRVDNDDLRELIELCTRLKRTQRPNVRELVSHSWFMESNGLKLEMLKVNNSVVNNNEEANKDIVLKIEISSQVVFRLKVVDKSKRKSSCPTWPDNEEVEFLFDVERDDPEQIVKELKEKTNKISDEDVRYLTQCIKDKCSVFKLEREDQFEEEGNLINSSFHSNTTSTYFQNNNLSSMTLISNVNTTNNSTTLTKPEILANNAALMAFQQNSENLQNEENLKSVQQKYNKQIATNTTNILNHQPIVQPQIQPPNNADSIR